MDEGKKLLSVFGMPKDLRPPQEHWYWPPPPFLTALVVCGIMLGLYLGLGWNPVIGLAVGVAAGWAAQRYFKLKW